MALLKTLAPGFYPYAKQFFDYLHSVDATFVVTSARRTRHEQAKLRQRFLDGKSAIYAAPPGHSMHELGLAFDVARMNQNPLTDEVLAQAGSLWQSIGGVWHPSDPVHFEAPT